ncbi:unnamed protein product (macronuclear) [Paramecium tetraurelia]|uniref:Uncharacterized protein n=1 Tax=Paramecium tetraurelia TaxID=5888 RepID=A0CZV2_PARTE|nr:uncharacterized protein GSPATT00011892001 [Paramecium tetraurelia]CAK76319.1 unnamed protein product [Paramecium tetraurelia]|eukprot:XP_001443716.1 hypothetical protein (macronuclear) [Paramecium tetraurelia strain d4-2]
MDMYKTYIFDVCPTVKNFQNKLESLLPNPNENKKLMKKIIKHKWVKIYCNDQQLQSIFHEDYCTYLIYNRIPIPNGKQYQNFQNDILEIFQNRVCQQIKQINQGFYENFMEQDINSQYFREEQVDNFDYTELVEYINYDLNDIISEEQEYNIEDFMRRTVSDIISKEYLAVSAFIKKFYSDLITETAINPSQQYPQQFSYGNFGRGFSGLTPRENKQTKIQEIQECQELSKLDVGIYSIKVKKTIIILDITTKYKIAYIINYFDHYKNKSSIFNQLKDFKIQKIKTIKLSVEEAYALIKYLKQKNPSYKQLWDGTIEFYKQQDFDEFNEYQKQKEQNYYKMLVDIKRFISIISPQSNNYKDIYSQAFVQTLQQNQRYNLDLIPTLEFDYVLKNLKDSKKQKAAILEDKQNLTIGVVLFLNQNQTILLLKNYNNLKTSNECFLESSKQMNQNEKILISDSNSHGEEYKDFYLQIKKINADQKTTIIFDVNIQGIQSSVAQFYVTLILTRTENDQLKNIKKFLELKDSAWASILKILG